MSVEGIADKMKSPNIFILNLLQNSLTYGKATSAWRPRIIPKQSENVIVYTVASKKLIITNATARQKEKPASVWNLRKTIKICGLFKTTSIYVFLIIKNFAFTLHKAYKSTNGVKYFL